MCLTPVRILNPARYYTNGLDKMYLVVPCGHCEECRRKKVNDWYVRLSYDYYASKKTGGVFAFVTLTYNPESLPYLNTYNGAFDSLCPSYGEVPKVNTPCFSKKDLQYFIKRLRALLCDNQLPPRYQLNIKEDLKYFVVSEFGHDKHRPHYHILFSLPKKVDSYVFQVLCELAWSRRVKSADIPTSVSDYIASQGGVAPGAFYRGEHYFVLPPKQTKRKYQVFHRLGFVSYSYNKDTHESKPFIESVAGIRYVLKYLFKDVDYMSNPDIINISQYLADIKRLSAGVEGDNKYIKNDIDKLKDSFPFVLSSNFLGDSLFKLLDLSDKDADESEHILKILVNGRVGLPVSDGYVYAIPGYITRRLFYQNRHYGMYDYTVLNDVGYSVFKARLSGQIDYMCSLYKMLLSDSYLNLLPSSFLEVFEKQFGESVVWFKHCMTDFENTISYKRLAYYKLLYQNCVDVGYLNEVTPSNFESLSQTMFVRKLDNRNLTEDKLKTWIISLQNSDPERIQFLDGYLYNRLPFFDGFDLILAKFEYLKSAYSHVQFTSKENQKKFRDAINNLYNSFIYV